MDEATLVADVEKLARALGELPEPVAEPALVVISGLPGTGKSYFSRQLRLLLPSAIVESDALRKELFHSPTYTAAESQRLFEACHRLVGELLRQGIPVILDATNLVEHHREKLYNVAYRQGLKLILVRVEAPPEVVRQRLGRRGEGADPLDKSDADWAIYRRMKARAQPIRRSHFAVDTSRDITPVIDKIVREARR